MRVFVVSPPEPVISLDEAKLHLRVDGPDEDALITAYVAAATGHIDGPDGWLGRAIGEQTLEVRFSLLSRPACNVWAIRLPFGPVIDLVAVRYLDSQGDVLEAELDDFVLYGDEVEPAGSSYPWEGGSMQREAGRIQYRAGYAALPPAIRAAILLMTGDLYANRETASTGAGPSAISMSTTVENLLAPFRVYA